MNKQNQIMQTIKSFLTNGKFVFLLFGILFSTIGYSQDLDTKINSTAQELAKKIISTNKQKVAIVEFENLDNTQTQLGVFLADEIASSLANLTENQSKFSVLERANLDQILEEKKILKSFDRSKLAKDLGKIDAAEILISATITEYNGYYRLNIKLLDTKSGNSLASYKTSFVQEPSLKQLQNEIVESSSTTAKSTVTIPNNETKRTPTVQLKEQIKEAVKGDVCFNNIKTNYSAIVILKNPETGIKFKTIDVIMYQKACAFNIPIGVYQMEINWFYNSDSKSSIQRTDTREINIKESTENIITIQYH